MQSSTHVVKTTKTYWHLSKEDVERLILQELGFLSADTSIEVEFDTNDEYFDGATVTRTIVETSREENP